MKLQTTNKICKLQNIEIKFPSSKFGLAWTLYHSDISLDEKTDRCELSLWCEDIRFTVVLSSTKENNKS